MIAELLKLKTPRTLRKNVWLKRSELQIIQQKKLRRIVSHAYSNVPFYHRLFNSVGIKPDDIKTVDDLSKIPIITKSDVQSAGNEIISRGVNLSKCIVKKTSGSTGIPLDVVLSKRESVIHSMTYTRPQVENGVRLLRDVKLLVTAPRNIPKNKRLVEHFGILKMAYISVQDDISDQLQVLRKTDPDVISGYASGIRYLATEVLNEGFEKINSRLVFTGSEVLDQETRNIISSAFGDVFDGYGSLETGRMAWECSEHTGYHMDLDTVVMEFIRDGERVNADEWGEVVVTNLFSYTMPLIRYKIGDVAIYGDEICSCGREAPLMHSIEGRSDDFLKTLDGCIVSPRIITWTLRLIQGISQFKVTQDKEDKFIIELVSGEGFSEETIDQIEVGLKSILGEEAQIVEKIVEKIPIDKSGKRRSVVSKVDAFD